MPYFYLVFLKMAKYGCDVIGCAWVPSEEHTHYTYKIYLYDLTHRTKTGKFSTTLKKIQYSLYTHFSRIQPAQRNTFYIRPCTYNTNEPCVYMHVVVQCVKEHVLPPDKVIPLSSLST